MIQPTSTRYLIRSVEQQTQTASGIILKGSSDTQLGEIVASGSEVEKPVPAGTKIIVDWQASLPIKHRNEQFYIIDQKGVLGMVED